MNHSIVIASLIALHPLVNRAVTTESGHDWVVAETKRQMKGCRLKSDSGIWLHTPDGIAHYESLWTRDFYYYLRFAGDLISKEEAKASILYMAAGQRADGCIPDRVNARGIPIYSPGGEDRPLADHAKDNGPFFALAVCEYAKRYEDPEYFMAIESKLKSAMDHTTRAENGLVYNPPDNPQCVYGFTDIIAKTGHVLFTSLLYYQACEELARLGEATGSEYAGEYRRRANLIKQNIHILWDEESGMFFAADRDCRQIDIWGSMFAVHLGAATEAQNDRIVEYFITHWDGLVKWGQVRHLPPGEVWERFYDKTLKSSTEPGTYQNGAYWSTPLAWIVPTLGKKYPEKARQLVVDAVADFRANGTAECVNVDYRKVPDYVPSITSLYSVRHWLLE